MRNILYSNQTFMVIENMASELQVHRKPKVSIHVLIVKQTHIHQIEESNKISI